MKNIKNTTVVIVLALAILGGNFYAQKVSATTEVCFCHNLANNPHTICTDNEGQINGHLGHVGNEADAFGACVVTPTQTPTATPTPIREIEIPTATPTPINENNVTPTPTGGNVNDGNIYDVCIPFITVCPTATPTPIVTATPTTTPAPTDAPVGGSSNNTSSSSSSSSSSPSTGGGQVLGATTMAATGVFHETLANIAMLAGVVMSAAGSMLYGKKNS